MDFETFMRQREQAALSYCQGDAEPVNELSTDCEPATFFGPDGSTTKGPENIKSAYAEGASSFGPNGTSQLEILQSGSEGGMGYWCGIQRAEVQIEGKKKPVTFWLTELFRREAGVWKLVHRHADALK
ncbi:MAG: YybH family protein [Rhizobiaceae bacterium]